MRKINILSVEGGLDVLRQLSMDDARFRDLNEVVRNTRTLTRRLKELCELGLVLRVDGFYRITDEGLDFLTKIFELEFLRLRGVRDGDFDKIPLGWARVSLRRLVNLVFEEFGDDLISIVLYGSMVRGRFEPGKSDLDLLFVLEDTVEATWGREEDIFRRFRSTVEYKACDHWFRMRGFYGYPEVTVAVLRRSYAKTFQPMYLDMLLHRAVLYDKEEFFEGLMKRLQETLRALGAKRVEYADGTWYWILKPDLAPGELIEINLE